MKHGNRSHSNRQTDTPCKAGDYHFTGKQSEVRSLSAGTDCPSTPPGAASKLSSPSSSVPQGATKKAAAPAAEKDISHFPSVLEAITVLLRTEGDS